MAQPFTIVGKSTPKRDGPDKVTGRTRFLHDLGLPRLAHGKILRSALLASLNSKAYITRRASSSVTSGFALPSSTSRAFS